MSKVVKDFRGIDYAILSLLKLRYNKYPRMMIAKVNGIYNVLCTEYDVATKEKIIKYCKELEEKPEEELHSLIEDSKRAEQRIIQNKENLYFFNKPEAMVDHVRASKLPYWTLEECIAHSLGRNPKIVNWNSIQPFINISSFAKEYADRRELMLRAQVCNELSVTNKPTKFIEWCEDKGIEVAAELKEWVNKYTDNENLPAYLNKQHEHYSIKLAAAIKTHTHLTLHPEELKGKSVKEAASQHIERNAASFGILRKNKTVSNTAVEEIAKIVNWKPDGGAPTT